MVEPQVRLMNVVGRAFIGYLPDDARNLSVGSLVQYGPAGAMVTYTIEQVVYVTEYVVQDPEVGPDKYSVYGRTDIYARAN